MTPDRRKVTNYEHEGERASPTGKRVKGRWITVHGRPVFIADDFAGKGKTVVAHPTAGRYVPGVTGHYHVTYDNETTTIVTANTDAEARKKARRSGKRIVSIEREK